MTNEEINRYIHTAIMGKCWHDVEWNYHTGKCKKESCHQVILFARHGSSGNPDYCSDDSPRRLLNEVVAKVVAETGCAVVQNYTWKALEMGVGFYERNTAVYLGVSATAEQIARACVEAHKESKK